MRAALTSFFAPVLIILAVSATFPAPSRAAQKAEVIMLDLGECWARPESNAAAPIWSIASFNDNKAFFVTPDAQQQIDSLKFQTKLTAKLKSLGFTSFARAQTDYAVSCGGGGITLRLSVNDTNTPLCVWAKPGATNLDFEITDVYPNPSYDSRYACSGVQAGRLIAGLAGLTDRGNTVQILKSGARYEGKITDASISPVIQDQLKITLSTAWQYRLADVKKLIDTDPALKGKFKYVEYDPRVTLTGEDLKLFSDSYPGF